MWICSLLLPTYVSNKSPCQSQLCLVSVAKSIRHSTAMSTILATELFQARHDAAIATSKLLLENSGYELRNAAINAKTLIIKSKKLLNLITKLN